MNSASTKNNTIVVYIALKEEFRDFREVMPCEFRNVANQKTSDVLFEADFVSQELTYHLIVIFGAAIGESSSARAAERVIGEYAPSFVGVIGIAGGLDKDLKLCDVVIADKVESYLENAKVGPRPQSWLRWFTGIWESVPKNSEAGSFLKEFQLAGEPFRLTAKIYKAIESFEFTCPTGFDEWQRHGAIDADDLVAKSDPVYRQMVNPSPTIHLRPVASGPVVAAHPEFAAFLKRKNRKLSAIEMESGGVLLSVHHQNIQPQSFVIRGISDFADERKSQLDGVQDGGFRKLAMKNATRLFVELLKNGLLQPTALDRIASPFTSGGQQKQPGAIWSMGKLNLQNDNVSNVVNSLKKHFKFIWEPGSFTGDNPVVFWPVRLRKPTPIHAAQTFAAAALSQKGATVELCLDNLGHQDHSAHDFVSAIKRWWSQAKALGDISCRNFSDIASSEANSLGDPWPFVDRWLGKTEKMLDEVLRISKTLEPHEIDSISGDVLKSKRPRRLLNPAVVWACLHHIASLYPGRPIITLGGYDERPLWDAWRSSITDGSYKVGHLYLPSLGKPNSPLHMSRVKLDWDSQDDVLTSLSEDILKNGEEWMADFAMPAWSLLQCISLPDFATSGCSTIDRLTINDSASPNDVVSELAAMLDERLLGAGG